MNKKVILSAIILSNFGALQAEEHQHGAHEHGAAKLGVAQEGSLVHIEIDSPAYNIIGFEYTATSATDKEIVATAVQQLNNGETLFDFPAGAHCHFQSVTIDADVLNLDDHDSHNDHDDDHGHGEDDDHDSHNDHDDDHGHGEDDDHDSHDEDSSGHSDIEATWTFNCENPSAVTSMDVNLFSFFDHLTDLDVQYIVESAQGAVELSPTQTQVSF